ncbi:MAG: hypothetical protein LBJ67_00435 [Planctomycetaceae bacterium]|nr:hypothetical protein [Planctomycetaceae bacterium]
MTGYPKNFTLTALIYRVSLSSPNRTNYASLWASAFKVCLNFSGYFVFGGDYSAQTSFPPNFPNKTTSLPHSNPNINEVMRFIFWGKIVATEVVLFGKLGGNEVFYSHCSNFPFDSTDFPK